MAIVNSIADAASAAMTAIVICDEGFLKAFLLDYHLRQKCREMYR